MSAKRTPKRSVVRENPGRGQADLTRLRRMTEREIARQIPDDFANLPTDFWDGAALVVPPAKQAISLRVDEDVLEWFRRQGPRYQTRMNAVLRAFMTRSSRGASRGAGAPRRKGR